MLLCNCIGRAGKGSRGKLLQAASGNSGGFVMYSQLVIWHHTDWVWCTDFRQILPLNCDQMKWNYSAFSYFLPYFRCVITLNVSKISDQLFFCLWLCILRQRGNDLIRSSQEQSHSPFVHILCSWWAASQLKFLLSLRFHPVGWSLF